MTPKKAYLLSSDLDYGLTVAPDVGPAYARRMGWPTLDFDETVGSGAWEGGGEWVVVDNRLSERECHVLTQYLDRDRTTPFLLKVIDPYYEWCKGHPYYRMLFEVAKCPNVRFITPYVPTELVADLDRASGGGRLVVVPYPYPADVEQSAGGDRKTAVIFSGNQHREVYPFRYAFKRLARWWPPVGRYVETLEHPGYPDIGQEKKHETVGASYVAHLSRYTHMFVSPSRCELEFLKYGECAAAACLPIGKLPSGFPAEAARAGVELDFDTVFRLERSARRALQMPSDEVEARAAVYRATMRRDRNAVVLNEKLDGFLQSASSVIAS